MIIFSVSPSLCIGLSCSRPLTFESLDIEISFWYAGSSINCTVKWDDHVATVASKAAKRLWFLKKLKRAGVSVDDLVHYYQTVIRPVLEYACAVWHPALTKEQTQSLENIQRRALQIIFGNSSCDFLIDTFQLSPSLHVCDRRRELCESLFPQIARDDSHVLRYLLPAKRDSLLTDRLRSAKSYPIPLTHGLLDTKIRFCRLD